MTAPRPKPVQSTLNVPDTSTAGPPDKLMTRREQAEMLNVSERTIARLEERGELPRPIRIGRRVSQWRSVLMARLEKAAE